MAAHFSSLDDVNLKNTWLTIGSFDGVHLGHQQLITALTDNSHQICEKSVVLTFHPHPSVILRGRSGSFYLTSVSEKSELLDHLGVDVVIVHPFTHELSQSSAEDFIQSIKAHLGFKELWVGEDFSLGRNREGNVKYLKDHQRKFGYKVHVVEPVKVEGRTISSSLIRTYIGEGKVEEANKLLGRRYRMSGIVVHGDGRGKSIGIPTANLETGPEKMIPGSGVYACIAQIGADIYSAAVNIGIRPTFESSDTTAHIEAHVLDFSNELYDQQIAIEFVSRLRGEQRFSSVNELIDQVHIDIEKTRVITEEMLRI